jgi:hypothetical protein
MKLLIIVIFLSRVINEGEEIFEIKSRATLRDYCAGLEIGLKVFNLYFILFSYQESRRKYFKLFSIVYILSISRMVY